ncbi:MAG: hypothetical protein U5K81_04720 [Trueperaceae bacterium]|nr:hypothetical protein [Trueperaceae bacterium]
MRSLREVAEQGAALMRDEPPAARSGIEEAVAYLSFWERELATVLDRWKTAQEGAGEDRDGGRS